MAQERSGYRTQRQCVLQCGLEWAVGHDRSVLRNDRPVRNDGRCGVHLSHGKPGRSVGIAGGAIIRGTRRPGSHGLRGCRALLLDQRLNAEKAALMREQQPTYEVVKRTPTKVKSQVG